MPITAAELNVVIKAQGAKQAEGDLKRLGAAVEDVGDVSQASAGRMSSLADEAMALGAVMGTLGSVTIAAGSAYRDYTRQVDGISRIYGDHTDQILEMTEGIQDFTRYSNDAARESALIASSLATNYDMSAEQIEQLIQRSADLAQIYGYELPDAVQRTSAALRGEGESAEMLGLNLSDAAVAARALDAGITNWNVPGALSEAEKAAFRFQLLMEDTEATVGAASDAAGGAGGVFREFVNEVDDGVEVLGRFLGPVGDIAAEMAPIAMALPVVSAGVGRLATTARGSAIAMSALGVATNPAVLGLGALATAGVLTWNVFREGREATQSLEDALIQLGDVATNLRLGHRDQEANWVDEMQTDTEQAIELGKTWLNDLDLMWEMAGSKAEEWGISQTDAVYRLQEAYEVTGDHARDFGEAIDTVGAAFANSAVDHAALDAALDDLDTQFRNKDITLDEYADAYIDIADNIDRYRVAQDASTESTTRASAAIAAMDAQLAGTDEVLARLDERYAALAQRQEDWIASMLAVSGQGDALSQWNLTGLASDAAMLADNLTDAAGAAETAFRVIVGNTDAIKNQADAVMDWADALIGAQGEASRLDELVNAGLITGTSGVFGDGSQYAQAQEAYNGIAESVTRIHDNLDAVQAIQAPLMAEMTAATAAYTDELLAMEPAAQLVALAWMDSATSAKAMEIATLGASAAAGELGVNGEAAFAAMVTGAAQADPVLKALLVDMGIISEGADGTITINTEGLESAQTSLDDINTTLSHMIDILDDGVLNRSYTLQIGADITEAEARIAAFSDYEIPQVTIPADVDTGAAAASLNAFEPDPISVPVTFDIAGWGASAGGDVLGAAQTALGGLSGATLGIPDDITVTINAVDNATPTIQDVGSALAGLDGASATPIIWANEDEAMESIGAVGNALATLNGATAEVFVVGDNSDAMAAIGEAQAYDGSVLATAYVNIVAQQVGSAYSVGQAMGSSALAGWDQATGTNSPSTEMIDRGQYLYQGLDIGWNRAASDLPIGFDVAAPVYPGYGASGAGSASGGVVLNVTNNITATPGMDEERIADLAAKRTLDSLTAEARQYRRSMGAF